MSRIPAALLLCLLLLSLPAAATAKKAAPPPGPAATTAAPLPEGKVLLGDRPLFTVKAGLLTFSPEDRARAISSRLAGLVKSSAIPPTGLQVLNNISTSDIVCGDLVVMSVTDDDARAEGVPRSVLAGQLSAKITSGVAAFREEYGSKHLLYGILYSLLATLVLVAALLLLNRAVPKTIGKLESWRGTHIKSLRFQSMEILNEQRIYEVLASAVRGTRVLVLLGLLYLYIPLVLSFFPWTHGMASWLLDNLLAPVRAIGHAFVSYVPNIFFLLAIAVVTRFAVKLARFIFTAIEKQTITIPGFYRDWADPTFKIVRFLMFAFAAVVAFPYLPGSDSPAFKGISVFLGVLFSLGSTSAVANIVSGVILTYMRAFKLGDRVQIADTVGDVVEKTLLITRVRTIKNVDITIPNSMVLGSHITNFSSSAQEYGLILHTTVTIGYDAPWREVHAQLIAAAKGTEHILELPEPFVFQTSLDDFFVSYQLNAYTEKPSLMARIYSELHQNIQDRFNEAGIEIMSPHYSSLRDGNRTTIPEPYLAGDYRPPGFRVGRPESGSR